jgi:aminoglycoside phosphotransferase (APT) family kinase protein
VLYGEVLTDFPEVGAPLVAALVRLQFPDVDPRNVSLLGEGCDSWAFEVDGRWVFRFPKRDDVEQQLLVESRVLPLLAAHSPLPLPAFRFHGRPSGAFPRRFVGYPKLPGIPGIQLDAQAVPLEKWAPVMGRFLSWLHRYPVGEVRRLGVEEQDVTDLIDEVRSDALQDFHRLREVAVQAPLEKWKAFFIAGAPAPAPQASPPVVVHRDLAAEHILFDPAAGEVTGVIDWSEIAVSECSVDLAAFFHWGGASGVAAALAHYDGQLEPGALARARFLAACRGVGDVGFGLETGRREYVAAGLRALELCVP